MPFQKAWARRETQTAPSRVKTRLVEFIFSHDNRYTKWSDKVLDMCDLLMIRPTSGWQKRVSFFTLGSCLSLVWCYAVFLSPSLTKQNKTKQTKNKTKQTKQLFIWSVRLHSWGSNSLFYQRGWSCRTSSWQCWWIPGNFYPFSLLICAGSTLNWQCVKLLFCRGIVEWRIRILYLFCGNVIKYKTIL